MTSKRSHHLIKLLMLIGVSTQQRLSLHRCHRLTIYLILWLIKTLSCWKMVRRICEITVTLEFIFRLVLYSHEDVSFTTFFLNVFKGIKQFNLPMWFMKRTSRNKAFCKKLVIYFSEKVQKIAAFAILFLIFSDQTIA